MPGDFIWRVQAEVLCWAPNRYLKGSADAQGACKFTFNACNFES